MIRPTRIVSCIQPLAEAADTLETSLVDLEVVAGMGKKVNMLTLVYLCIGVNCIS